MRSRVTTSLALTFMIGTLGVCGAGVASAEPTHTASITSPSGGPLDGLFDMLFGGDDDETSSSTPDPDVTGDATSTAPADGKSVV